MSEQICKKIARHQTGGGISPRQFTLDYINSPNYKKRLQSSGYLNVEDEIKGRSKNIETSNLIIQKQAPTAEEELQYDIKDIPYSSYGSAYNRGKNTVIFNEPDAKNNYPSKNNIISHEYSHSETTPDISNVDWEDVDKTRLNKFDNDKLTNFLLPLKGRSDHSKSPNENKADLNSLRFELKSKNIYDSGTQEFKKEYLNKLDKSFAKDRLLKNYSPEALEWLMNNIAQNNVVSLSVSMKEGGVLIAKKIIKGQSG